MTKNFFRLGAIGLGLAGMAHAQKEADAIDQSLMSTDKQLTSLSSIADRVSFGSYGEFHAQFGDGDDNVDLHRLVLLINFQLTENLKFVTETEFEHALYHAMEGDKSSDLKIEIEQAYFNYTVNDGLDLTAGIQLIPAGIINLTHEPTTFYGVERPNVEKYIVPTTWWEGAVGAVKKYDNGLQLDVMLHTGLDMTSEGYVRSGRPKLTKSDYEDTNSWAVTTRAKYTGIAGVELAGTVQYQYDVSSDVSGNQSAILTEAHAIYRKGGFEFRALGAYWDLDNFDAGDANDAQWGYYLEPSYAIDTDYGRVGAFTRFSHYDYVNSSSESTQVREYAIGVNYWPTDELVFKADYVNADSSGKNEENINLGFGWYF